VPREPRPTEVAETLTRLREAVGLSTPGAVAAVDGLKRDIPLTQPTLSRYEHARIVPPKATVEALCDVYGADPATRERLLNLTREASPDFRRTVLHHANAPRYQREYRDLERRATRIRSFTATIVDGLLQTADYARAVIGSELTGAQRDRWLLVREKRRTLLHEPARHLEFVLHASALTISRGGPDVMAAQLAHLDDVSRLDHVRLGVIGKDTDVGSATILNNINYYELADGPPRLIVGTTEGTAIVDDPTAIVERVTLLDRLAGLAAWGDEAREVLARAGEWYR
jgi:hypothetical protein